MGFSLRVEGPCSPKDSLDYKSDAGQRAGRTLLIERVERPQKAGLVKSLQKHSCSEGGSELGGLCPHRR